MNRRTKWAVWVLISTLTFFLTGSPAWAKGHGGGGGTPGGFSKGGKKGWHGASTPPGWSHGKKKGWGDAGKPPGLAKKSEGSEKGQGERGEKEKS